MAKLKLCVVSGQGAADTACLIGQILSGRARTGLVALTGRFGGTINELLHHLEQQQCRQAVLALPEEFRWSAARAADTVVLLSCSRGEAAEELLRPCHQAVITLDDPDGVAQVPAQTPCWTFSERHKEADLTAENLRLLPFDTEFEAVTRDTICRIRVPLSEGRGLYPGLAAVAAGLSFGIPVEESAQRMHTAQPESGGMIALPGQPYATVGYFEEKTERIREI